MTIAALVAGRQSLKVRMVLLNSFTLLTSRLFGTLKSTMTSVKISSAPQQCFFASDPHRLSRLFLNKLVHTQRQRGPLSSSALSQNSRFVEKSPLEWVQEEKAKDEEGKRRIRRRRMDPRAPISEVSTPDSLRTRCLKPNDNTKERCLANDCSCWVV